MSDLSRLVAAFVVGAGVAASGLFVGGGLERFRMADRSIAVKGLAEQGRRGRLRRVDAGLSPRGQRIRCCAAGPLGGP